VLSGIWLIAIAALIAYAVGRTPDRDASGTVTHQGAISPVDLRVGDCVKVPGFTAGSDPKEVDELTVVPCAQAHNGQMVALVQSTDTSYPGSSQLTDEAQRDCVGPAQDYLGKPTTRLDLVTFVPDQKLWNSGERGERCLLVDSLENITGDIRPHA
jgi:hypothetical protein